MSTGAAELLQDTGGLITDGAATETPQEIAARSPIQLFWRRLRQDKVALTALAFILLLIFVGIFAGVIVKLVGAHPPNAQNPNALDSFGSAAPPGKGYIMGTDGLGRDVFSRTLYGARVSLEVAFIATGLIVVIGVALGMIAGYYRGAVDTMLSRSMDVVLAFPVLLLALGLGAACSLKGCLSSNSMGRDLIVAGLAVMLVPVLWAAIRGRGGLRAVGGADWVLRLAPGALILLVGLFLALALSSNATLIQPGLPVVIFVITLSGWPYMARIIRGQVLSLREKEFVEAARSLGASDTRIIFRHILPNIVAPIIVYTTLLIPTNILFEAALSFLGVGVQPPTASWGAMIADAIEIFDSAWWYMTFPGVALLLTVLAFNLVGDGLQDALNPRTGR
ncbi:MAG: peptide/nickel transport system permease protein [Solirubrobacteraceae bacterium]|nr:peptide/nickel transport system permease protein [Solirubrobacteraceae bacterium]MEA2359950.1 peptide/nickel transport system permease protein [Solirubrobacteraceae bacterium]